VEIPQSLVEITNCKTSTKRSSNLVPFDRISKNGDGGNGGDIVPMLSSI
jgi:hypothetical protein